MLIGEKIQKLRKANFLTQEELGKLIGTDGNTVSRWERNKLGVGSSYIAKLAKVLNTTADYLMGEGEPQEQPQINLPINNAPENKTPEYLGLGYWGTVADNARRIAKIGSEQDKAAALMMLRMATDAITGAGDKQTGGNFIAVQENHQHVGDNYVKERG